MPFQISSREADKVSARFPAWEAAVQTKEFRTWLDGRPDLRSLVTSPLAEDAIELLEEYRADKWRDGRKPGPDRPKPARISSARDKRLLLL